MGKRNKLHLGLYMDHLVENFYIIIINMLTVLYLLTDSFDQDMLVKTSDYDHQRILVYVHTVQYIIVHVTNSMIFL